MTEKPASPLIFGEILFDCFPDGQQILGGAPFNVAWHLQGFGLQPQMVSRVGDDALGKQVIQAMQDWGMRINGVQVDTAHSTGQVAIKLDNGEPQYDIVNECAYDFIDVAELPVIEQPGMLYHGSLALRNAVSRHSLHWLCQRYEPPKFVDINLRAPWWGRQQILAMLMNARWIKLNDEELTVLSLTPEELLAEHSPSGYVLLTQGEEGAHLLQADEVPLHVCPDTDISVIDSVGAGDAFSSIMILGEYKNWPLPLSMQRAQAFASAVVEIRGAISTDVAFYDCFKSEWVI